MPKPGKPSTMTGWWRELKDKRADGNLNLLATLIGVPTRTIHRWCNGVMKPRLEQRNKIRAVAGDELVFADNCPAYLRIVRRNKKTGQLIKRKAK